MIRGGRRTLIAVAGAGALSLFVPVVLAQSGTAPTQTAPREGAAADRLAARTALLDAAAGWRDVLEAHRAPSRPRPGDTESLILVLTAPPAASAPAGAARAQAAREARAQQERLLPVLADLDATVLDRTRVVANTITVRVPTGRAETLARLSDVRQVVPVGFLAPAAAGDAATAAATAAAAPAPRGPATARISPVRIALIDTGVDTSHPALGGGMGPTFPVLGGEDLVDGDGDPRITSEQVRTEAHGTQMAGVVLASKALSGLAPERHPRLLVYRVAAAEPVSGRLRPLARTDRVLGAIERAVDPDGDGDPRDRAEVILIGLAGGFAGGGVDPVADAAEAAHGLGSTVVVPAGNDGPTLTRPGSLGALASAPSVITVGGVAGEGRARTARLDAHIGPAAAGLTDLPLMGPAPGGGELPAVFVEGPGGLLTGDIPGDYADEQGRSRVRGALAVVARGGGTIEEKARAAAAAGARALAVWDESGPATFAVSAGDLGLAIPVVGLGRLQGAALQRLVAERPDVRLTLAATDGATVPRGIASFSSWGPTADGRQKPELVAPAVAVPAPLPGRAADGRPRAGSLTGTSAAAAEVAARAARLRADRPGLGADGVRSLLVQGARPLDGVPATAQGAGEAGAPAHAPLVIRPAIVHAAPAAKRRSARVRFTLVDISGRADRYTAAVVTRDGAEHPLGAARTIGPGRRARIAATLAGAPRGGTVVVRRAADGRTVATAPLRVLAPARAPRGALAQPAVRVDGGLAQVMVRIGSLRRERGQVRAAVLHSVRIQLVPAAGGAPIDVRGAKQDGDWAPGIYRFLLAARGADGLEVPPGVYRVRVIAAGAGGVEYRRESTRFSLG